MVRNDAQPASLRHRPVSCHFCRTRKLRCSRLFPCPNCTTRGLNCQLHSSKPLATNPRNKKVEPDGREHLTNPELLARLQRLESIVLKTGGLASSEIAALAKVPLVEAAQNTQNYGRESVTTDPDWLERECVFQDLSVSSFRLPSYILS